MDNSAVIVQPLSARAREILPFLRGDERTSLLEAGLVLWASCLRWGSPCRALWSSPLFCLCSLLLGSSRRFCFTSAAATKRMEFPAWFFRAWTSPTLQEYYVSTLAPSGIASKITVHVASLRGGAFLAALAHPQYRYVCSRSRRTLGACGLLERRLGPTRSKRMVSTWLALFSRRHGLTI